MRVSLVTVGDPDRLTGGYLYHRRVAWAGPRHGAAMEFVSFPAMAFPLPMAAGPRVLRSLRAQKPDVVVVDSVAAAYVAPWRSHLPRPLAAILHQPPGGIDHARLRTAVQARLDLSAYAAVDRILVASEALAQDLERRGVPEDRLAVVAPGRDPAPVGARKVAGMRRGRRAALLCVANWIERKGISDLLDAFGPLPPDLATLHLVGDDRADPSYAARIRRRLGDPALRARVVVHGPLPADEVTAMYASADAFVLPSRAEPYGTVYGEAMAHGLPVIGWRAGNLPNLARDGVEGLVAPTGDVRALTNALKAVCEDERLRAALSSAAKRRAESFPTWDDTAATFFAELRRILPRGA